MGVVRLPVLVGPTAAGKSWLATRFAAVCPVTIVSADSRQLYRGFDIGTAKPTLAERHAIPHVGIDVADPHERWNASRWAAVATGGIEAARTQGRVPLIVGGTGLYVRALFEPLFEEPPLDPDERAALDARLQPLAVEDLREQVRRIDPERAHLGRTQLLRAIEVAELTGRPLSQWHREAARPARYAPTYLLVDRGEDLRANIATRVDEMLAAGWLEEVRGLASHLRPDAIAWNATGYAAIRDVVEGRQGLEDARQEVIIRTRQYAKRQRTWFRHQLAAEDTVRLDLRDPGAAERALEWWKTREDVE